MAAAAAQADPEPTINLSCLRWAWRACSRRFSDCQTDSPIHRTTTTTTSGEAVKHNLFMQVESAARARKRCLNYGFVYPKSQQTKPRERERGRKNRNALRLSPPWTSVNYPHILENLQSFANVNEKLWRVLQYQRRGRGSVGKGGATPRLKGTRSSSMMCYSIITIDFICLVHWYCVLFWFDM